VDGPANASPDDRHDQLLDASLLPSQPLTVKVLRPPIESAQYTSFRYTSRLAEVGVMPSIGSVADSFDNAMAESLIGTFKAELINRRSWRTREEVEFAVVEWVAWYNTRRLHSSIGDIPPAEFEANYSASTDTLQPIRTT
jgi:putative transposase